MATIKEALEGLKRAQEEKGKYVPDLLAELEKGIALMLFEGTTLPELVAAIEMGGGKS